jgi:invasion protein IalB
MSDVRIGRWRTGSAGLVVGACLASVVTAAAAAKDGAKSPEPAFGVYEAQHGAWSVNCDPCVSYEESICIIWADAEPASISLYPLDETDPKPQMGMSFHPGGELAYLSEGTLEVSIDGAPVHTLAPPAIVYSELMGDMFVEAEAVAPLLPRMRTGTTATFSYTDVDGTRSTDVSLAGFQEALEDLFHHLPYPRGTHEPGHADSCPY